MKISRQSALAVLAVLLVLLLLGTQMPGAWRDEAFRVTQLPWQLSKVAHFVVFAGLACVVRLPPLAQPLARVWVWVWAAALALGLLTEGLQFFASHRDPSVADVAIDLAGAALGLGLAWAAVRLKLLRF
jgi:VanZ family protein